MDEKRTVPLPAEPLEAGRRRVIVIAAGAVVAVAVGVVAVAAACGGPAKPGRSAIGAAAATSSPAPYITATDGGYSQQPRFTWSPRPGQPSPPTSPVSVSTSPSAPQVTGSSQPASLPAPPAGTTARPPSTPPRTSAPPSSTQTSMAPAPYQISGTVSCLSGHSVEGVWVQAAQGSGYSPWQGIGNGSTSRYWYTLPNTMSFSLHIGCGGTTSSWGVALTTPQVSGPVANFTCHDISGQPEYGTCDPQ